jgi:DNA-binding MarR family transcriptional regulator
MGGMPRDRATPRKSGERIDLERFVPALLTFVANRLTNSASATYRRLFGIGVLDFRVMVMLALEPGVSGARIAEVIDLDKAAVSRTLRSLEKRGLISAAAGHGRARILRLTAAGETLYNEVEKLAQQRERVLLADLPPEDRETLRRLLRQLLLATARVASIATEPTTRQPVSRASRSATHPPRSTRQ